MAIDTRPILTDVYDSPAVFVPDARSTYIYAWSPEQRSRHTLLWSGQGVESISIFEQDDAHFRYRDEASGREDVVLLRNAPALRKFCASRPQIPLYIDITGLDHHVWAPLLKAALSTNRYVRIVYVEPASYSLSVNPTEGVIFDLSEKISGIRAIPGFAALSEEDTKFAFVPLLGFEGPRFTYVLEEVKPENGKTFPIIGIPGFRMQYPFYTYVGNRLSLTESEAWHDVRFVPASCPFSVYYALEDIASISASDAMKIAPIGTKPHAVGAVLFALAQVRPVELVYDHPKRKATRTSGTGKLHVYHVSGLFASTRS